MSEKIEVMLYYKFEDEDYLCMGVNEVAIDPNLVDTANEEEFDYLYGDGPKSNKERDRGVFFPLNVESNNPKYVSKWEFLRASQNE